MSPRVRLTLLTPLALLGAPFAWIGIGLSGYGYDAGSTPAAYALTLAMLAWLAACVLGPIVGWWRYLAAGSPRAPWWCVPALVADVVVALAVAAQFAGG